MAKPQCKGVLVVRGPFFPLEGKAPPNSNNFWIPSSKPAELTPKGSAAAAASVDGSDMDRGEAGEAVSYSDRLKMATSLCYVDKEKCQADQTS